MIDLGVHANSLLLRLEVHIMIDDMRSISVPLSDSCPAPQKMVRNEELLLLLIAQDGKDYASALPQTAATGIMCLRPAKNLPPCAAVWYDVVRVSTIQRPVYIQPRPQQQAIFTVNHFTLLQGLMTPLAYNPTNMITETIYT